MGIFDGLFGKQAAKERKHSTLTIDEALAKIRKFWPDTEEFPFHLAKQNNHVQRLEAEFGRQLPQELAEYVANVALIKDLYFDNVGNPMSLWGSDMLGYNQDGFNYNSIENTVNEGWPTTFFILGDDGGDPMIIDLADPNGGIKHFYHDAADWSSPEVLADTIGQLLLCLAAKHHALNRFEKEPIIDDQNGFNLAPKAADWYFSNMKVWAGDHYDAWCAVFDNH